MILIGPRIGYVIGQGGPDSNRTRAFDRAIGRSSFEEFWN